ncbi:MAG: acetyltransferase, family [Clostridia bacterium]|jgi:L-amino acid N-acyltransferase YncA|nr:acetyltransferase, family [Clostridia bacterium]
MVKIYLATEDDISFLYEIKSNEDNMNWAGHSEKPVYEKLKESYLKHIQNQDVVLNRKIYIISGSEINMKYGYLYLDPIDYDNASVSVAVLDKYSGKGIGRTAIERVVEAANSYGYKNLIAEIREDNIRSQRLFTTAGFNKTEEFRLMYISNIEREIKMLQYNKEIG